jgi:hypothetical protein
MIEPTRHDHVLLPSLHQCTQPTLDASSADADGGNASTAQPMERRPASVEPTKQLEACVDVQSFCAAHGDFQSQRKVLSLHASLPAYTEPRMPNYTTFEDRNHSQRATSHSSMDTYLQCPPYTPTMSTRSILRLNRLSASHKHPTSSSTS